MSRSFEPAEPGHVVQLIAEYPLAWVVSADFQATPLPLIVETDAAGAVSALVGHFARRNPQIEAIRTAPDVLLLFQGPQSYVSPRLVSKPAWGPTWNYAVARLRARLEFLPDMTDEALLRLARHVERAQPDPRGPWQVEEMGPRYAQLREHIIAFRAHVTAAHATFKLGQDEDEPSFRDILAGFAGTPLARYMTSQRK